MATVSCSKDPVPEFRFVTLDSIPAGKAIVYVYRPASVVGDFDSCNMNIQNELLGALGPGQYTYLFVDPGKTRFETTGEFRALVTVNLKPGQESFIRQTWVFDAQGYRPQLEHMTRIRASEQLSLCRYVETPPIVTEDEESGERED
jgi:hypothetical protein